MTHSQRVAFIVNTLTENSPLLMLTPVSAPHSTLSFLQSSHQALVSISFIIQRFLPSEGAWTVIWWKVPAFILTGKTTNNSIS